MIVCAASNNAGKLKELRRILERMGHEVKSLRELGIDLDPEETGTTFAENARIKAEAFCKASGLPTVADDSASAPTRCTVRPASTAPATPGITATTTRTTQSCCGAGRRAGGTAQRKVRVGGLLHAAGRTRTGGRGRVPGPHCVYIAERRLRASAMTRCSSPTSTAHPTASARTPNAAATHSSPPTRRTPSATEAGDGEAGSEIAGVLG